MTVYDNQQNFKQNGIKGSIRINENSTGINLS